MRKISLAVLAASSLVATTRLIAQGATTTEIRHPDGKYVDQSITARVVRFADAATGATTRALRPTPVTMGAEDGSDDVVMSRMNAVAINRSGQVLVLDELSSVVRVFDPNGSFVQRIGRAGKGPGDFFHARVMTLSPDDDVVVYDLMGRLQVFRQRNGRHELSRTIPIDFEITAMCFLGNRLFANAMSTGARSIVHAIDYQTGQVTSSFGSVYNSPSFITNVNVSSGKLVCDQQNQQVVLATSSMLGEIRAWKLDGTPAWRVSIADYKSNKVVSVGESRKVELSPDGITSLHSLSIVPDVGIVANYGMRTRQQIIDKEAYGTPSTLVINPLNGTASWLRTPWPIIAAMKGSQVATVTEEPYPMVRMYSLSTRR